MSTDYYAVGVVGVKLTDVVRVRRRDQKLLRYNEETGEPYYKDVVVKEVVLGANLVLGDFGISDRDELIRAINQHSSCELEIIEAISDCSLKDIYIGVDINSTGDWDKPAEIPVETIVETVDMLSKQLVEWGFNNLKPRFMVQLHISY